MKRIVIVTMHRGNNYGSALQTYALSEAIKKIGGDPIILDYIPQRINFRKAIIDNIKTLLLAVKPKAKYDALRSIVILASSYKCYNRFFKRNLSLTKQYHSLDEINKAVPKADVYMTGSDQVWNSLHNRGIDEVFYLSFVPDKKKVAYAASFGRETLENWEIDATKRLLCRYEALTVRELSGVNVLRNLDLEAKCVLDPTFLLDKSDWTQRRKAHADRDKYVLIYSVEPDKESVIKVARAIADKLGAKVFMVEWGYKPYPGVDKMVSLVDPLMLIDYFLKAEFVVASSFHGTALSLNLNRSFISLKPAKFNTRVESILNLTGERDRLVSPEEFDLEKALRPIDYGRVNAILDKERANSRGCLKEMLR